ncbi:MAG: DUF262 domain-containing protein [Woronichinia naegeliana WA131]|jgi:hypothetical protein|uniref:DUF262 domain-containing protein n=1 Tax=Woronichinia naegeliana WA131 TaxID=2824559 RepID=A0A977PTN8_9CYAN|nr:MAG: DUF262 domain-containing protein [Woronichinia naegeliana WA131]
MINTIQISSDKINPDKINKVEEQIRQQSKPVDYNTLEYPIEIIVQKYLDGEDKDENEIFIPDYQREMVWSDENQSKFIESIFLGLPIPYIFIADVSSEVESEDSARLEIIDGTQRVRTLARFLQNELVLKDLKKLTELNGLRFGNLSGSRQKRFRRIPLRMIQLTEEADEGIRRDLFERINSGSIELNEMEKRIGGQPGLFLDLIQDLAKTLKFQELCHFSQVQKDRRDPQEYVLRFYAFLYKYKEYPSKVHVFLDDFLINQNEELKKLREKNLKDFDDKINQINQEFNSMLDFVSKNCPEVFRVGVKEIRPTTRSKFESISVGISLALRENPNLSCKNFDFLKTDRFDRLTDKNSSSSRQKVEQRIEYVRDYLLKP